MTDRTISPLRRRMTEDMRIRGFTAATQRGYIAAVRDFTAFLGRSPDHGSAGDLRRYQLHLRSGGASATSMNAAVSALRFFFGVTLGRSDAQVSDLPHAALRPEQTDADRHVAARGLSQGAYGFLPQGRALTDRRKGGEQLILN